MDRLQLDIPPELASQIEFARQVRDLSQPEDAVWAILAEHFAPAPIDHQKETALAFIRKQCLDEAVKCARPGETTWDTTHRANLFFEHIFGEHKR